MDAAFLIAVSSPKYNEAAIKNNIGPLAKVNKSIHVPGGRNVYAGDQLVIVENRKIIREGHEFSRKEERNPPLFANFADKS
jgi:hypothetical protein